MKAKQLLPFVKASACGNDFLLVQSSEIPNAGREELAQLSRRLCDRNQGVGADGVEWLYPDPQNDIRARLFNADGSEAEISGNGTRCVAAFLSWKKGASEFKILTGAGTKICRLLEHDQQRFRFSMQMGRPEVEGERAVPICGKNVKGTMVSTGNPHFVIFVEKFPAKWQEEAAILSTHRDFPQGTNVELVQVLGRSAIEFRIYERGAGETRSSGTGSCASAIAAIQAGLVESPVEVRAPGGTQIVRWDKGEMLELVGDAVLICQGEFFL